MTKKNIAFTFGFLFLVMALRFIFLQVDQVYFQNLGYVDKGIIVLGVLGGLMFWIMMLTDFFNNKDLNNKTAWGISLIFLSWLAAIFYFIRVFLPRNR